MYYTINQQTKDNHELISSCCAIKYLRMMKISGEVELCAAIVHMASPQKNIQPKITILPRCGSIGRRAKIRPNGVNSSFISIHFISTKEKKNIIMEDVH